MSVTFDLPEHVEQCLRGRFSDLDRTAKEALAIELYRAQKISIGFLAEMLGLGVIEADRWLATRGIPINYTPEDLQADRDLLRRLVPEPLS